MTTDSASRIAKITRPRPAKVVTRSRLFALLDTQRDASVVWIAGPPGAGKTTLVTSYIEQNRLPCLWYQIDEGDNDIASFFYYMALAGKRIVPRRRKSLPLLTPEYLAGTATFARKFFRDLYSRLKSPGILVFDNYQEVPANSPLHEVVQYALSEIPEGINVIVISRTGPPANLARLSASGMLAQLSWKELRLTQEECANICQLRDKKQCDEQMSQKLHELTRGWVAGLVLLLEQAKIAGALKLPLDLSDQAIIFDYFANEIFENSEHKEQDFLLKTAFVPKISVKIAQDMTGNHQAESILVGLTRRNYFTVKHASSTPIYEYHPLFRQFLLTHAKKILGGEQLTQLQRLSASSLIRDGQIEEAALLLREIADWQSLSDLVLSNAHDLVSQGRYHTLASWLRAIPSPQYEQNPWLLFWQGHSCLPFDQAKAMNLFVNAFSRFRERQDCAGVYMAWAAVIDSFFYQWADFTQLDKWISIFFEIRQSYPEFPSHEIAAHTATSMFSALMFRQPHHPELPQREQLIIKLMRETSSVSQRIMIGSRLLLYYVWFIGDVHKAGLILDALHPQVASVTLTPLASTTWFWMQAFYYWFCALPQECLDAVESGLEISHESGVHQQDFMLLTQQVMANLMLGGHKAASASLKRIAALLQPSRLVDLGHYHYTASLLAYYNGELVGARTHATTAIELADKHGILWVRGVYRILYSQALFESGERKRALVQLSQARRIGKSMHSANLEFGCWLCVTMFAMDMDKPRLALALLRETLRMGNEYGYSNRPLWTPKNMRRLFSLALENDIEVSYVQGLIRKHQLSPSQEASKLDNWPWCMKLRTLGQFSLEVDGAVLALGNKKQNKPIELLKALIAFGGKAVTEDKLTDALWPEVDGDAAHHAFETTLYRLRKLIGNDKILVFQDGLLGLDPHYCWVDVWAFEHVASRLQARLSEKADSAHIATLADRLTTLYPGPFLQGSIKQPWARSTFERLRHRRLQLLIGLGQYEEQARRWRAAAVHYHQGLELEPVAEELYQRLMVCYRELGQRTEALAIYERCRRILSEVLAVEPARDTREIHQTLRE